VPGADAAVMAVMLMMMVTLVMMSDAGLEDGNDGADETKVQKKVA
jgi:hypothetical protein